MSGMEMAAFAALSGAAQIQGARSVAGGLAAQSTQTRIQARSEALKYKQQGVAALDNILATQAAIVARAGVGGIDPFSGSARALQTYAQGRGADEYFLSREGGMITTAMGEAQAREYMRQGRAGIQAATIGAIANIGTAYYMQSTLGSAPAGASAASVPQANTAGMGSQRGYFSR